MKKLSLQEVLEGIEDTRRRRSVWYPLYEVLFIMLTAVICGATSYAKVEMFGKSKEKWLKKYIKLENGVPDACTFRNVIKAIDTQQLHTVFVVSAISKCRFSPKWDVIFYRTAYMCYTALYTTSLAGLKPVKPWFISLFQA